MVYSGAWLRYLLFGSIVKLTPCFGLKQVRLTEKSEERLRWYLFTVDTIKVPIESSGSKTAI